MQIFVKSCQNSEKLVFTSLQFRTSLQFSNLRLSLNLVMFCLDMSLLLIGFCLREGRGREGCKKVVKWSLISLTIVPEVMVNCFVFVKMWSIKDILSLNIRVAFPIVWMNPYCIAFSIRLLAVGTVFSFSRLILESVKIKESWLRRDISDIRWSNSVKNWTRKPIV